MAEVKQIALPGGTYTIKDATARNGVEENAQNISKLESQTQQDIKGLQSGLTASINDLQNKLNQTNSRINTIASLPDGSTAADAEIIDAREGFNGTNYSSLGEAIRSQMDLALKYQMSTVDIPKEFDLNNFIQNGLLYISSPNNYKNTPTSYGGTLINFVSDPKNNGGNFCQQYYIGFNLNTIYKRVKQENIWSDWTEYYNGTLGSVQQIEPNTDLNDLTTGTYYLAWPTEGVTNYPFKRGAGIIKVINLKAIKFQQFTSVYGLFDLCRINILNRGWNDWTDISSAYKSTNKYYAFGDSTTYGQTGSGTTTITWPNAVGLTLKMQTNNYAQGGEGLLKDWDNIIAQYVNGLNFENVKLITIAWAYNDVDLYPSYDFGSPEDTTLNTYIGRYYNIMKLFQEKAPQAQVILVSGYGSTQDGKQWTGKYTFKDGQHTAKEMYDTLEEMCYLNGWCMVNQAKGCWVNNVNWSSLIEDNIHPNANGYTKYCNFMSAKISALFNNIDPLAIQRFNASSLYDN